LLRALAAGTLTVHACDDATLSCSPSAALLPPAPKPRITAEHPACAWRRMSPHAAHGRTPVDEDKTNTPSPGRWPGAHARAGPCGAAASAARGGAAAGASASWRRARRAAPRCAMLPRRAAATGPRTTTRPATTTASRATRRASARRASASCTALVLLRLRFAALPCRCCRRWRRCPRPRNCTTSCPRRRAALHAGVALAPLPGLQCASERSIRLTLCERRRCRRAPFTWTQRRTYRARSTWLRLPGAQGQRCAACTSANALTRHAAARARRPSAHATPPSPRHARCARAHARGGCVHASHARNTACACLLTHASAAA
jgi:hypothetical protein